VVAGVIISESQWHSISRELKQLCEQSEFRIFGEIKWRYFGRENSDPRNPLNHLMPEKRDEFRRSFFRIITKRKSCRIVACVTNVANAYRQKYIKDEEDLYFHTYKPVSERFQYYLQDLSREVGSRQLGIVVADHRGKKQDDGLRSSHHRIVEDKSPFTTNYENFIETIFLTPSHASVGIQFADMIAGAIGRGFNTGDWAHFLDIKTTIRAKANGEIVGHGIVKFPNNWRWEPPGGA
jgi:hypothetical protein